MSYAKLPYATFSYHAFSLRYAIFDTISHLVSSSGIAPNTMLAKVCSDKYKPNGQYRVLPTRDAVMAFIADLPIRKVGICLSHMIIDVVLHLVSF